MIKSVREKTPLIGKDGFIAESAEVLGEVIIGDQCIVWHGAIVRGDIASITIGDRSNVQDNAVIHVSRGVPTVIGEDVSIGHNATIHACTIEDNVLVGMGATVLDHAVIGRNSILGAGTVVGNGKVIPEGSLVLGVPGKVVRELSVDEIEGIRDVAARNYRNFCENYL